MAYRPRGRGRGRGFVFRSKQEPFIPFPDNVELPAIDQDKYQKPPDLVQIRHKLQRELKGLPYFLEETFADDESVDIERYSDKVKKRTGANRTSLEDSGCGYMMLRPGYFPQELLRDLEKLDLLEAAEEKFKDEDEDSVSKQGKDGEEDKDEEGTEGEEEDEEDDDVDERDDYDPFLHCDDDDDPYNDLEDDDDEGIL